MIENKKNTFDKVLLTNGKLEDKLKAHLLGLQHYAFSVFIFDDYGRFLLQQRAISKYHSGGLWSNTCCSHPLNVCNISIIEDQVRQRLIEEMGINCYNLRYFSIFVYNSQCNDLKENEVDYIFYGYTKDKPKINSDEVKSYRWESLPAIYQEMEESPQLFTTWFCDILKFYGKDLFGLNRK